MSCSNIEHVDTIFIINVVNSNVPQVRNCANSSGRVLIPCNVCAIDLKAGTYLQPNCKGLSWRLTRMSHGGRSKFNSCVQPYLCWLSLETTYISSTIVLGSTLISIRISAV